jgi:hypothetical protein
MIHPLGKFMIKDTDTFMELYCRECVDHRFGLLESTSIHQVLPVLVDADIKKEITDDRVVPLYDASFTLAIIRIYQDVLRQILREWSDEDLVCVVLEKKPYLLENEKTKKKYIKHGFHLHFPRCLVSRAAQETELIPRVKLEWKKQIAQNEFPFSIDSVIDRAYCRGTPWLLYRSSKSEKMEPYLISFIVDAQGISHDDYHPLFDMTLRRSDQTKIELTWDNVEFHLPRILSISPQGKDEYVREIRNDLTPIPSTRIQNQIRHQLNHMTVLS